MKRILLIIFVALASFAAGLAGLYFAMPMIDPDGVEQTRTGIDSLLGRTVAVDSLPAPHDSAALLLDPMLQPVLADSAAADSVVAIPVEAHPRFAALVDSLDQLERLAQQIEREREELKSRADELERRLASLDRVTESAADLSATLTRLEDEELRQILGRLDDGTLARLYGEASGRNKTRVLASLPSERAARLVQHVMTGGSPTSAANASYETEVR